MTTQLAIPEPWLSGQTLNYDIEHGLHLGSWAREPRKDERPVGRFLLPPFQRPSVWNPYQKVRFIESIWLELPIASYVVNSDHREGYPCDQWLLDGQQRWTAIVEYVEGMFPVFGLRFRELDSRLRLRFKHRPFPAIQTRDLDESQCREIYNRLSYGGTPHESGPSHTALVALLRECHGMMSEAWPKRPIVETLEAVLSDVQGGGRG